MLRVTKQEAKPKEDRAVSLPSSVAYHQWVSVPKQMHCSWKVKEVHKAANIAAHKGIIKWVNEKLKETADKVVT